MSQLLSILKIFFSYHLLFNSQYTPHSSLVLTGTLYLEWLLRIILVHFVFKKKYKNKKQAKTKTNKIKLKQQQKKFAHSIFCASECYASLLILPVMLQPNQTKNGVLLSGLELLYPLFLVLTELKSSFEGDELFPPYHPFPHRQNIAHFWLFCYYLHWKIFIFQFHQFRPLQLGTAICYTQY